jgi:phage baseplate assembly protein W
MVPEKGEHLGNDLQLRFDSLGADLATTASGNLAIVSGSQNMAQAIIARLTTGKGELNDLGHPEYGSRLYELFGQPNTERTRESVRKLVRECLAQELRLREVLSVNVKSDKREPSRLEIEITVLPIEGRTALSIVYPFNLEVR